MKFIAKIVLAATALLQLTAHAQLYRNYAGAEGAQPVAIKPGMAIVRFKKGVEESQLDAALRREQYFDTTKEPDDLKAIDAKLVYFVKGLSQEEADAAIKRLLAEENIEMASPVVTMVPGGELFASTTEHFYMSFETPFDKKELDGILDQANVEVERVKEYEKLGRIGYWLKCTKDSAMHGLAMSNMLYDTCNNSNGKIKPVSAGANFASMYDTLASTPYDTYYHENLTHVGSCSETSSYSTVGTYSCQQNLDAINVPAAWDLQTGSPHITVAVVDSGVDMLYGDTPYAGQYQDQYPSDATGHPDLNGNQWLNITPGNAANDDEDLNDDGQFTEADENNYDDDNNGYADDFYGWDWVGAVITDPLEDNIPYDDSWDGTYQYAHGTSVAGVIAARANNSAGVAGIAGGWGSNGGVKIMPLRAYNVNFDNNNCQFNTHQLEMVAHAVNYATENGANVINMSLGDFDFNAELADAVDNAHANDVVMVAAAQNFDNRFTSVSYPGKYEDVICVGALNWRQEDGSETVQRKFGSLTAGDSPFDASNPDYQYAGVHAGACLVRNNDFPACTCVGGQSIDTWGSDYGPELDLMAPGFQIYTTDITGADGKTSGDYNIQLGSSGNDMKYFNKTSSATPQVSAVAALLLSDSLDSDNKPTLTPTQVQAFLCFSADDMHYTREADGTGDDDEIAPVGRDIYTGWGRVNARAALDLARAPRLEFQDSSGRPMAHFDHLGNMVLEYSFIRICSGWTPSPGANDFVIADSGGAIVALLENGNFYTSGGLYTKVTENFDLEDIPNTFLIRDENGDAVAAITSDDYANTSESSLPNPIPAGSVLLRGMLMADWQSDGSGVFELNCP